MNKVSLDHYQRIHQWCNQLKKRFQRAIGCDDGSNEEPVVITTTAASTQSEIQERSSFICDDEYEHRLNQLNNHIIQYFRYVCHKMSTYESIQYVWTRLKRVVTPQPLGICGLISVGNTCYMNSAIQCLNSIVQLTDWCRQQQPSGNMVVVDAYCDVIQRMWSGTFTCVDPRQLKETMSEYSSLFTDYEQKDCHEFINTLLNAMDAEGAVDHNGESIIHRIFSISTESQVVCSCCQEPDYLNEMTTFLSLPLRDGPNTLSLVDLFDDFVREKQLDGKYYCPKCDGLQEGATQKTSFRLPLPDVLIIQLQRFQFDNSNDKLSTKVNYPRENLDLGRYMTDKHETERTLYDLSAICIHMGNLKHGHYTTMARHRDGDTESWFYFNDQFFERIANTDVSSEDAYLRQCTYYDGNSLCTTITSTKSGIENYEYVHVVLCEKDIRFDSFLFHSSSTEILHYIFQIYRSVFILPPILIFSEKFFHAKVQHFLCIFCPTLFEKYDRFCKKKTKNYQMSFFLDEHYSWYLLIISTCLDRHATVAQYYADCN